MPGGYDIGGSAIFGLFDIAGLGTLEVFYLDGRGTFLLGPVYAPPLTGPAWPVVRQPRMHRTAYLRTPSRSGHGVRSTAGEIPHQVMHPPRAKLLRQVQIVTHTMDEKPKVSYVKRAWE